MKKRAGILLMGTVLMLSVCDVSAMENTADDPMQNYTEGMQESENFVNEEESGAYPEDADTAWEAVLTDDSADEVQYLDTSDASGFTGWWQENGYWYYYKNDQIQTGWLDLDGSIFYLDESTGSMSTGWLRQPEGWYYFDTEGRQVKGWIWDGVFWYYLMPDTGIMTTEPQTINGSQYRFSASGAMYANAWYKEDGNWYYYGASGAMSTGWVKVNGYWYYLDEDGIMQTGWKKLDGVWYYLDASGSMASESWRKVDGEWYYFAASGRMVTGWNKINSLWYYMYDSGKMAHDTTIDGYELSSSGAWNPGAAAAKAAAQGVIALAGNDLYNCFEWIVNNCTYVSVNGTPPEGYTWEEWRASEMFNNRQGDCHNYAALFGYVARELGYDAQIISGYTTTVSGTWVDHGWVEIDGVRYDPDLEYELGINGFGATGIQYKYTLD